jgi:hypothetical protein
MNLKTVAVTTTLYFTLKILIYYGTRESEPVRDLSKICKSLTSFNFRSRKKQLILVEKLTVILKKKSEKFLSTLEKDNGTRRMIIEMSEIYSKISSVEPVMN